MTSGSGTNKLRILIAERNRYFRETIRRVVERYEQCTVVGEASALPQAIAMISECHPDLVLLDPNLSDKGRFSALRRLLTLFPSLKVAVLLSDYTSEYRSAVHAHGGSFSVAKDHLEEHLAWIISSLALTP